MKAKNTLYAPLLLLGIFAFMIIMRQAGGAVLSAQQNLWLTLIVLQLFIFVLPAVFYTKLRAGAIKDKLNLGFFAPNKIFFICVSTVVLLAGTFLIRLLMYYLFGTSPADYAVSVYDSYITGAETNLFYIAAAVAVIPAITEEFVFRAVMTAEYSSCRVAVSAIMTSAMFAMIHFNIRQFPIYFFAGLVLFAVATVTKSCMAAMLVHVANNLFGLFLDSYISGLIEKPDNLVFLIFLLVAVLLVSLYFMFSSAERIYYLSGIQNEPSPKDSDEQKQGIASALFSPTFLVCIAVYIAASLLR